jgi:O-methyltransferase
MAIANALKKVARRLRTFEPSLLYRRPNVTLDEYGNDLSEMPEAFAKIVKDAGQAYGGGDLEKAKAICREGLKEHRYNRILLNFLARSYCKERNYIVAEFFVNYAGPPNGYSEHLLRAEILRNLNEQGKATAKTILERACTLSSAPVEALGRLAILESDNNNMAKAEKLANKCLALDGKCHLGLYAKGKVLHARNALRQAREYLHKALIQDPAFVPAMEETARILIEQKDYAGAKAMLAQAVNSDRQSIFAIRKLIELHLSDSDYAAAEPLLLKRLKDVPHDSEMAHLYSEMLQKQNRLSEAKSAEEIFGMKSFAMQKNIPAFIDQEFLRLLYRHHAGTMVNWDALYSNFTAARYVAQRGIPGDVVECGVAEGGSAFLMAETLKMFGATDKKVYLYDTFEGMSEPTGKDVWVADNAISAVDHYFEGFGKTRYDAFLEGLNQVDYPRENLIVVKGKVEDTIPSVMPERISLLRLDTDWYESTLHELVHLYPRLVEGGILICDDYGCWQGAREAMDEYCKQHNLRLHFHTNTIQGSVIANKY